jgi:hypothetical protein
MFNEPSTKIDGRLFGTAEEAPAIGSFGLDHSKKTGEATNGRKLVEPKIHLETSTNREKKGADRRIAGERFRLFRHTYVT